MAAISADRLLALFLGLRHRHVVTIRRVYIFAIAFWVSSSVVNAVLTFFTPDTWKILSPIAITLLLMTSIFCYVIIFLRLHQQQTQVRSNLRVQDIQTTRMNITRYRKTVSSAVCLQLALVFCYTPHVVLAPLAFGVIKTAECYIPLCTRMTLMFFNSTFNSILYCWKIEGVRRTVKNILSGRRI